MNLISTPFFYFQASVSHGENKHFKRKRKVNKGEDLPWSVAACLWNSTPPVKSLVLKWVSNHIRLVRQDHLRDENQSVGFFFFFGLMLLMHARVCSFHCFQGRLVQQTFRKVCVSHLSGNDMRWENGFEQCLALLLSFCFS